MGKRVELSEGKGVGDDEREWDQQRIQGNADMHPQWPENCANHFLSSGTDMHLLVELNMNVNIIEKFTRLQEFANSF